MPLRRAVGARQAEPVGPAAAEQGLAVAGERVALVREPVELGVHHPGVLHELELARDVGAEADEMQPARLRRFGRLRQGRLGREHRPVGAAAADQPVEAGRRHHVVAKALALEAQHAQQAPPERLDAARQVAGARVGAADVGAERAADAVGVVVVEEAVGLVLAPVRRRCRRSACWSAGSAASRPGAARPWRRPGPGAAARRGPPARRRTARSRGRPAPAGGTRGSCRSGPGRGGAARPARAAGARPRRRRPGRAPAAR